MLSASIAAKNSIPLIQQLTYQIWPQTYSSILSKEQLDYMLNMMYSEASLTKQMDNGSRFIIAYDNEEAVGFAAYYKVNDTVYKLDKIYILPSQQGKGTGKFLLEYIYSEIKITGANTLRLNVNRHNNARKFYEKNGFTITGEGDFDIGNGYFMNDYIMEKKF